MERWEPRIGEHKWRGSHDRRHSERSTRRIAACGELRVLIVRMDESFGDRIRHVLVAELDALRLRAADPEEALLLLARLDHDATLGALRRLDLAVVHAPVGCPNTDHVLALRKNHASKKSSRRLVPKDG